MDVSEKFKQPTRVNDYIMAIGRVDDLMPLYQDIPDTFKKMTNQWVKWQQRWFFDGLCVFPEAKDGVDMKLAMMHLTAIQRSYLPKHEHKQAAVAFLASLWFSSPESSHKTSP